MYLPYNSQRKFVCLGICFYPLRREKTHQQYINNTNTSTYTPTHQHINNRGYNYKSTTYQHTSAYNYNTMTVHFDIKQYNNIYSNNTATIQQYNNNSYTHELLVRLSVGL
jgi:hypothetical protein